MASKAAPNEAGQSDFLTLGNHFFCSFLGSLFGHFLTKFWTPLGVSLGVSWEPSRACRGSLGRPLDPKTLKKLEVFQGFWKCSFLALWSSWWLSWAHLAPSLADLVPKWAPKWFPKVVQKVIKKLVKNDTKNDQTVPKKLGPKRVQKFKKSLLPQAFFKDRAF